MMSIRRSFREEERPRERCLERGARCLSLRECLALILNSGPPGVGCLGLADAVLSRPGLGLPSGPGQEEERAFFSAMEVSGPAHLSGITGLGPAGQARLLVAFEIGRRYALYREAYRARESAGSSRSPQSLEREAIERVPFALRSEPQEWIGFVPVYRGGKGHQTGQFCLVERGVRSHVNFEPGELFARALALRPQGFFLFHNHPSGDLTPSVADHDLTLRVQEVCGQLGLQLHRHGILSGTAERWIELDLLC